MKGCCDIISDIPARQRRVLQIVLAINAAMFLVEFVAGIVAHSTALLADSVDMLGDAIVYGFSLYAIARGPVWQVRAALIKGAVMAAFGAGVLVEVGLKITRGVVPSVEVMGGIGLLALAANTAVLGYLWRRRTDDINMRSAWICSRSDVIANGAVLLAAAGVALMDSFWPDVAVGLLIAAIFVASAVDVIGKARRESVWTS
ncbi:MAG: cation transporter [Candidatus Rokuibacteriota bacterium]